MKDAMEGWVDAIVIARCGRPHLEKQSGLWVCGSLNGSAGMATTQRGAYEDWLAVAGESVKKILDGLAQARSFCDLHPEWRIERISHDA